MSYSGFLIILISEYIISGVEISGLSFDWCEAPETGLLKPDLVLYLTLSPEVMAIRRGFGDERYEIPEFQQKVRKCFDKLYDASYWQKVDANQTEYDLTNVLAQYAEETIQTLSNEPLKTLW